MAVDGMTVVLVVVFCTGVLGLVALLQQYCPPPPKQCSSDHR